MAALSYGGPSPKLSTLLYFTFLLFSEMGMDGDRDDLETSRGDHRCKKNVEIKIKNVINVTRIKNVCKR